MISPTFRLEKQLRKKGLLLIAGTDEAGSGAWAGPVFAGAAVFEPRFPRVPDFLRDSKLLSPAQRENAFLWVTTNAQAWAVGEASAAEIDALNIRQAGFLAMRRALEGLGCTPEHVLSDGFCLPANYPWPSQGIIKGDRLVASISAASIIAKVLRDRRLRELDLVHPGYQFAVHKGYGTAVHQAALAKLGPTAAHRVSYAPIQKFL
jgi:ribonuclease HII